MSTTSKYELPKEVGTALFEAVEGSGVSRREVDLRQLCNSRVYTFGESGSDKRRAVQKIFAEAKRKGHQAYLKYIGKYNVNPGEVLKKQLLEEKEELEEQQDEDRKVKGEDGDSESEFAVDSDSDSDDSSFSDDSEDSTITTEPPPKKERKQKLVSTPTAKPKIGARKQAPINHVEFTAKKSPQKAAMASAGSDTSDTDPISVESLDEAPVIASDVERRVDWLEKKNNRMICTKQNPYIIIADPKRPESCWGFEVALVKELQVGNFVRNVFHIRHTTTQGMEDEWSAKIPHQEFPNLANRAVLIRGPSQELWHRRPDLYHEESFCDETFLVHKAQQTEIKKNEHRLFSYWLLVLPKGTMLENHVISGDSVRVKVGQQEMTKAIEMENDDGATEVESLYGMDVYWRIALAGGIEVEEPGSAEKKKRRKKKKAPKM